MNKQFTDVTWQDFWVFEVQIVFRDALLLFGDASMQSLLVQLERVFFPDRPGPDGWCEDWRWILTVWFVMEILELGNSEIPGDLGCLEQKNLLTFNRLRRHLGYSLSTWSWHCEMSPKVWRKSRKQHLLNSNDKDLFTRQPWLESYHNQGSCYKIVYFSTRSHENDHKEKSAWPREGPVVLYLLYGKFLHMSQSRSLTLKTRHACCHSEFVINFYRRAGGSLAEQTASLCNIYSGRAKVDNTLWD